MKKAFYLLLLLATVLSAQTHSKKTIYQALKLSPGGCSFDTKKQRVLGAIDDFEGEGDAITYYESKAKIEPLIPQIAASFKAHGLTLPSIDTLERYSFTYGSFFYKENGLIGLKDKARQVVLPAQFTWVLPDGDLGFVGYKGALCNYYNSKGHKILHQEYYFVQRLYHGFYLIQSAEGRGVIDSQQKIVLKPEHYHIDTLTLFSKKYFKVYTDNFNGYLISSDGKERLNINITGPSVEQFAHTYVLESGELYNLTTKKKLICEEGYYIRSLNEADQTLQIMDKQHRVLYFADVQGHLRSDKPFVEISYSEELHHYIAAPYSKDKVLGGVMDKNGTWLLPAQYSDLIPLTNTLLIAQDETGNYGVITLKGQVKIPHKYRKIRRSDDRKFLLCIQEDQSTLILRVADFSIVKEQSDITRLSKVPICDKPYYIADAQDAEWLVDEQCNKVTEGHTRIFYNTEHRLLSTLDVNRDQVAQNDVSYQRERYYSCDLQPLTFTINGVPHQDVYGYERVTPDLSFISLADSVGYFIRADGSVRDFPGNIQAVYPSHLGKLYVLNLFGGSSSLVNSKGDILIPPVTHFIGSFTEGHGFAPFVIDNYKGMLRPNGELLFGTQYDETVHGDFNLFFVKENNAWGVVDVQNRTVIPLKYDAIYMNGGLIKAQLANRTVVFDLTGKQLGD